MYLVYLHLEDFASSLDAPNQHVLLLPFQPPYSTKRGYGLNNVHIDFV